MEADVVALWKATGGEAEQVQGAAQREAAAPAPPLRIWRFLFILLVMALLVESVVANWHLKVQREV
jgi:hypothetical protein